MGYKTRLNYNLRLETLCRSERRVGIIEHLYGPYSFYSKEHLDSQTSVLLAIVIHHIIPEYQLGFCLAFWQMLFSLKVATQDFVEPVI